VGHGALGIDGGTVDSEIAKHAIVQACKLPPIVPAEIPGDKVLAQSSQRVSETGARHNPTRGARLRRKPAAQGTPGIGFSPDVAGDGFRHVLAPVSIGANVAVGSWPGNYPAGNQPASLDGRDA